MNLYPFDDTMISNEYKMTKLSLSLAQLLELEQCFIEDKKNPVK